MIVFTSFSVVRELVRQNRMVVNDEDEDSNTALHLAALAGHNKVVQALIDNGADIEARFHFFLFCFKCSLELSHFLSMKPVVIFKENYSCVYSCGL